MSKETKIIFHMPILKAYFKRFLNHMKRNQNHISQTLLRKKHFLTNIFKIIRKKNHVKRNQNHFSQKSILKTFLKNNC